MSRALSAGQITRKPAVHSKDGVVVSQNRIASEIGAEILRDGGNAVDAAVAISFALGVVEPWMSGIGGGGYMIVRHANETSAQVIDFGMCSPAGLQVADYPIVGGVQKDLFFWPAVKDDANVFGARSVAIPGVVAGMGLAHEMFGTRPLTALLAPAIAEARAGLSVDWYCQLVLASAAPHLAQYPGSRAAFLDAAGFPKSSGWVAVEQTRCNLTRLADTLEILAREGTDDFYRGDLADRMVRELNEEGGRHSHDDFAFYKARIVPASEFTYRDHRVFGTPELTAGPTLERVLDILMNWQPKSQGPDAAAYIAYDQAIRAANTERMQTMGDIAHEPVPGCTSHFNVIDRDGTLVAVTQTLLSMFGSRLMLPTTGVLMNNGIMWFDPALGKPNSIAPGKRCLSNMMPTLLEHRHGRRFALGGAGGRKIMPAMVQLVSFLLDFDMGLESAMHTPRIDCSMADVTVVDETMNEEMQAALQAALPSVISAPRTVYPFNFACPAIAEYSAEGNAAVAETMAPWAEAVAE
ncbi:MAG: gamma-glutamyltransferase [Rhodobacteraceae bacterium]|nr:gamma-glutamyltransferase [Paracoccaceae bacterium]